MAISRIQQGFVAQQEFVKLLTLGSGGRIELAAPLTDEERRDYEIHVRGKYGFALAVQVKSTTVVEYLTGHPYMGCRFRVRATRLVSNPYFWYFVAYLDVKAMRFADPVYLIPSEAMHKHANGRRVGAYWDFKMVAGMDPKSRSVWQPYRVNTLDLGKKALKVMSDLQKQHKHEKTLSLPQPPTDPGLLWLRKAA